MAPQSSISTPLRKVEEEKIEEIDEVKEVASPSWGDRTE